MREGIFWRGTRNPPAQAVDHRVVETRERTRAHRPIELEPESPVFDQSATGAYILAEMPGFIPGQAANPTPGAQRLPSFHSNAKDRRPVRSVVTAQILGDPPPHRAGRVPDCEDAREEAAQEEAVRMMERVGIVRTSRFSYLDKVSATAERLAPRRYQKAG